MQLARKRLDHHVKKRNRRTPIGQSISLERSIKIGVPLTQLDWNTRNYVLTRILDITADSKRKRPLDSTFFWHT